MNPSAIKTHKSSRANLSDGSSGSFHQVSEGFERVEVINAGGAGSTGLKGTILH
jgi:hypothetical protein